MKKLFITTCMLLIGVAFSFGQDTKKTKKESADDKGKQIVEASCGQCNFGLTGGGCDLAVRIGGEAYYVDGSKLNDHGDAHAKDGMCVTVRKAEVEGDIVDGRFKATSFKVLAEKK